MVICASIGCNNSSEDNHRLTFHRFPKNPQMRNLWILAMRRKNWIPSKHSVLCSAHFTKGSFSRNLKYAVLKKKAVPSIFPCYQSSLQSKANSLQDEQYRNLELENAINFMSLVKKTFRDDPEVYENFVHILTQYKIQRIKHLRKAKWHICKLFKGHPELIAHINNLLPDEWKFETQSHEEMENGIAVKDETVQKDGQSNKLEMEKVLSFMNEVKNAFSDKPEVYDHFLYVLNTYKSQSIDCMRDVHQHVLRLFGGHPVLLARVNYFLPCEWKIKMELNEQPQEQNSVEFVTTQIKEEPKDSELDNASSSNTYVPSTIHIKEQEPELKNPSACVNQNEFEVYQVFTNLLKELKKQRINTPDVIERVSKFLQAHPELVSHVSKSFPVKREH